MVVFDGRQEGNCFFWWNNGQVVSEVLKILEFFILHAGRVFMRRENRLTRGGNDVYQEIWLALLNFYVFPVSDFFEYLY